MIVPGLLCSQDPSAALRAHASLAGARNPNEMDVAGFLDQAEEYETRGDVRDSLLKLLQLSGSSHPAGRAARSRTAEVGSWAGVRRDSWRELPAPVRRQGRSA